MSREFRLLLTLELREFGGINRYVHTRDPRERRRYQLLAVAFAIVFLMVIGYTTALSIGLCMAGLHELLPAYLAVLSSLLVLFFGLFKAGARLFFDAAQESLAALPLRQSTIAGARLFSLYLEELAFSLLILLPGLSVYTLFAAPAAWFYPVALLGILCMPLLPLIVSVVLGTLIAAISARMRHKTAVQSVLSLLFVSAVMSLSFFAGKASEGFGPTQLSALVQTVGDVIARVYPPAMWFGTAITRGNVADLCGFAGLSLGVAAACIIPVLRYYEHLCNHLHRTEKHRQYTLSALTARTLYATLIQREAKRYFSSTIYVVNTITGPFLALILAVSVVITGVDTFKESLPLPIDIVGLMPFVLAATCCMMTTTSVSLSMEGNSVWLLKTLPIPVTALFDTKLLFNLLLITPFYVAAEILLCIALAPHGLTLLWLWLIPAVVCVFSCVSGLMIDRCFHRFDWTREETIVKQSASSGLGGFLGPLVALLGGAATAFLPAVWDDVARAALCILLLTLTALFRRSLSRTNIAAL